MGFLLRPPSPQSRAAWDKLLTLNSEQLTKLGLIEWGPVPDTDEDGEPLITVQTPELRQGLLMLLPARWKDDIPADYEVVDIFGQGRPFGDGEGMVEDQSVVVCGYLSYGVLACSS